MPAVLVLEQMVFLMDFQTGPMQEEELVKPPVGANVQVWNPAFDVTPSSMITGVITDRGMIRREQRRIDVRAFMTSHGLLPAQENGHGGSRIVSPIPGFKVVPM